MKDFQIPEFLMHLPVHKGYPVPYFVTSIDGVPDFRMLDARKQLACLQRNLCGVCGFPLGDDRQGHAVLGPLGLHNCVSTDPTMHEECARFSIKACPHLSMERTERRHVNLPKGHTMSAGMVLEKPKTMYMVKCIPTVFFQQQGVFKFLLLDWEEYIYANGKLTFNRTMYEQPANHDPHELHEAVKKTGRPPYNWPVITQPRRS